VGVVAGVFPDGFLGGDGVGEGFAHEGAPRERSDVAICEEAEDLKEEFVWEVGEEGEAPCGFFGFFGFLGRRGGGGFGLFLGF